MGGNSRHIWPPRFRSAASIRRTDKAECRPGRDNATCGAAASRRENVPRGGSCCRRSLWFANELRQAIERSYCERQIISEALAREAAATLLLSSLLFARGREREKQARYSFYLIVANCNCGSRNGKGSVEPCRVCASASNIGRTTFVSNVRLLANTVYVEFMWEKKILTHEDTSIFLYFVCSCLSDIEHQLQTTELRAEDVKLLLFLQLGKRCSSAFSFYVRATRTKVIPLALYHLFFLRGRLILDDSSIPFVRMVFPCALLAALDLNIGNSVNKLNVSRVIAPRWNYDRNNGRTKLQAWN